MTVLVLVAVGRAVVGGRRLALYTSVIVRVKTRVQRRVAVATDAQEQTMGQPYRQAKTCQYHKMSPALSHFDYPVQLKRIHRP